MSVLQMQRVSICALKKDRKVILEKLQSMGIMEMNQIIDDDEDFAKMDTLNARQNFEKKAQLTDQALDVLERYVPEKHSLFAALEGKKLVEEEVFRKAEADKEEIIGRANHLLALDKEIAESKADILKLRNQIESLQPWLGLEVPMNYPGTKTTAMLVGTMAGSVTLEDIYAAVAGHAPEVEAYDVQIVESDKDAVYLAVFCMKEQEQTVENALRAEGFARPSQMTNRVPKELEAMLVGMLGGRAAEEIVFDTVTTGASNDIEKATKIARSMITQYGMSEKFGLIGLESIQNRYLDGRAVMNCGEATAAEIDQEVMEMLKKAYDEAKRLLTEHREALDKIAAFLIEKETITGKEFMKIFHEVEGIDPDAPKKTEERIGMKAVPGREKAVEADLAAEKTVAEDTPEEKTVPETPSADVE